MLPFKRTFCLLIHNETTPDAITHWLLNFSGSQLITETHLKYSFVAIRSPFSSKTEKRIPLGGVLRTWSHRHSISRSKSYEIRCFPPSKRILFLRMAS